MNLNASDNSIINQAARDIEFKQISIDVKNNYTFNCWHKIDFPFIDKFKSYNNYRVLDYILGASCKWSIIANEQTVPREIVPEIIDNIQHYNIQALLGAGGEGKTTILMQIAYKLYKKGWTVYYHIGKRINLPDQESFDANRTIFIVDDVVSVSGFDVFLTQVLDNEYKMLFSSRSNEWAIYCEDKSISSRDIHIVETTKITELEATQFATYIVNNCKPNMDKEEIIEIFINKNNGFLYSAMLCSVYGKNLEEIAKNIISRIYKRNKEIAKVLACVCLIEETNKKMSFGIYNKIYQALKIPKFEICNCLSKEIKVVNSNYVETRHPVISTLFSKYLYKDMNSFFDEYEIWSMVFEIYHTPIFDRRIDKGDFEKIRLELLTLCIKQHLYEESELLQYLLDMSVSHTSMYCFINHIRLYDKNKACEYIKRILTYDKYSKCSDLWKIWIGYELYKNNVGDISTEYTARWIIKQAVKYCPNDYALWLIWINLEIRCKNIGDVSTENTARWLLNYSTELFENNFKLWSTWAKLEIAEGNIGDVNIQNSARWIFKTFLEKYSEDYHLWFDWAKLEVQQGNVGEIKKIYSARWIVNNAYKKSTEFAEIWDNWEAYKKTSKSKIYKTIKILKTII